MRTLIHRFRTLLPRASCPVPTACPASASRRRLLRLCMPLLSFVVPTVVIGYGFVIPKSCIHGFNGLSFGFGSTVFGACMAYVFGIRAALRS